MELTRKQIIEEMRSYSTDFPQVGLFWFDSEDFDLKGVASIPYNQLRSGNTTHPKLHKQIWTKEYHHNLSRKNRGLSYDDFWFRFKNYEMAPRGRVFYYSGIFYVLVGQWATNYPGLKDLILETFDLPSNTKFKYDEHWDIGYEWSSENEPLDFTELQDINIK